MDPYKLLTRSTKLGKNSKVKKQQHTPSGGQNAQPQLFSRINDGASQNGTTLKKRKRGQMTSDEFAGLDFFGGNVADQPHRTISSPTFEDEQSNDGQDMQPDNVDRTSPNHPEDITELSPGEYKAIFKKHKVRVTWLNPPPIRKNGRRKDTKSSKSKPQEKQPLFPQPLQSFRELHRRYNLSGRLASNIKDQGYTIPTEVQLGALPLLLDGTASYMPGETSPQPVGQEPGLDLLSVAPTGSGKTLAFMIFLIHRILSDRPNATSSDRRTSAIILAPTKELVSQILNEGRKLVKGTGVRIAQIRKGMRLGSSKAIAECDSDDVENENQAADDKFVKADMLVATPGILENCIQELTEKGIPSLSNIRYLVLDEADVLLDPLFREQTLRIWNGLPSRSLHVSLWSATMGSNIEELAQSVIKERRRRVFEKLGEDVIEAPLIRLVVGLKDSAVPNIQHRLIYCASEQGKLLGLRQILHPSDPSHDGPPPLLPPFLVFTQTIERAIALHSELSYDIPTEAGGSSRIAVLHSDLSDTARDRVMTGFRKGEIWILITTDLLSRGVDFQGMNGVVNYDMPTSSAAYVHRVGRTGRAGREGGVAITLYSKEDIPYLKQIANIVAVAQKQNGTTPGADGVQPWLLDALPRLGKKAKQDLKRRGVEARTARGMSKDPHAARKVRISTKPGFVRRQENRKKGAIAGSQRRKVEAAAAVPADGIDDGSDFSGFD